MSDSELTAIDSSLDGLLEQMTKAHEADLSFEEQLQQLKEKNAVRLATLDRKQQQEYFQAVQDHFEAEAEKKAQGHRDEAKALQDKYNLDSRLSDKEFKEKYKMSKKAMQQKIKLENDAADKIEKNKDKIAKKASKGVKKATAAQIQANNYKEYQQNAENVFGKGKTIGQRLAGIKGMATNKDGSFNGTKLFANLTSAISDMAKQLDSTINTVASYKSKIDTRLQGLNRKTGGFFGGGSAWDNISKNITGIAGISPLVKQSDLATKVSEMVGQGIAFNVEQRATLAVLKDKIATTFDAANGTLLRLVRIQQQDTTAARLGMESSLTAFLNNMYSTSEYMQSIAAQVKGSLEEAMSLMTGENALSFEYQVQKWLGSLYSTGMSEQSVSGLSGVLGKLASGQLDAITQGGQGNLVIMAANQAGLSVADILSNGLNAQTTNDLMNAMVRYLAQIAHDAGDSKVIQQQMASIYGVTAADLRAAVNLAQSVGVVARDGLTYSKAMSRLTNMANSMYARTSIGEMMTNAWENFQYTMASGIASNPALYAMYKASGLLDSVAGGIPINIPTYMGTGMPQTIKVSDLMRVAAMSGSIISGIGSMIASGGNGGITGAGILRAAGVYKDNYVTRGNGAGLATAGGASVSESGSIIGNSSSSDVQGAALTETQDSSNAQIANAADTSEDTKLREVYSEVVDIYNLLKDIAAGSYTIAVDVKNPSIKVEGSGGGL